MYIAEMSWGTLLIKNISKSATVITRPMVVMRLLMHHFIPPANDMTRMF